MSTKDLIDNERSKISKSIIERHRRHEDQVLSKSLQQRDMLALKKEYQQLRLDDWQSNYEDERARLRAEKQRVLKKV